MGTFIQLFVNKLNQEDMLTWVQNQVCRTSWAMFLRQGLLYSAWMEDDV
jgi:hypothetical protein